MSTMVKDRQQLHWIFLILPFFITARHCQAWSCSSSSSSRLFHGSKTISSTQWKGQRFISSSCCHDDNDEITTTTRTTTTRKTMMTTTNTHPRMDRRDLMRSGWFLVVGGGCLLTTIVAAPSETWAYDDDDDDTKLATKEIISTQPLSSDVKRFFNEARALESQGNIAASQRLYSRITQMEPNFIYGWSQLGNTQTALGELPEALDSYTKAINLCIENNQRMEQEQQPNSSSSRRKCTDLYILLLNRGSIRLNTGQANLALQDLMKSNTLRARPDAVILQNLARAKEMNGQYNSADRDYTTAILMTSNEVSPFWLRSAMVKYQIGDGQGAMDLLKRVENKFPQAPEVRAAYAVLLLAVKGDMAAAQQKYLEIPNRARSNYIQERYLTQTIAWPPAMRQELAKIAQSAGDGPTR